MRAKGMPVTRNQLWIVFSVAVLAGCAGQTPNEQPPVGVEERKPGATGVAPQKPSAEPRSVQGAPVGAIDLTKKPASEAGNPLKDPQNILSKRAIFFDYDRFDVRDEFKSLLEAHARYLREHAGTRMLIQGNTDERGAREYNLALGQKRAEAIKRVLTLLGVKEEQVEAVSIGEEKPRAPGQTEDAYAQNRRGDILYQGEY